MAKSKDRISHCDKGQTLVAYRRIGMHLLSSKWSTTSTVQNYIVLEFYFYFRLQCLTLGHRDLLAVHSFIICVLLSLCCVV